jgi:DNA repair exonuclease SbcCD nuclease subunit
LHIGLTSTRVRRPNRLSEFSTAEAWRRIVELAESESVRAVLLAGDIVDQNNRFFEAIGPLQRGIERLAESDIITIAVSGNHDHEVLRRLASELPPDAFRLLGADGTWERVTVEHDGQPVLHVDGVSFPGAVVRTSPLEAYELPHDPSVATLAIVHGDIHDASSRYRPLDLRRLQRFAVDGWLLGHIHADELIQASGAPWVLYPGSAQALDPGEEGAHGPWVAEISGSSVQPPVRRPLSSVLYASVDADLSGVDDEDALEGRITSLIRKKADELVADAGSAVRVAVLRCRFHGATPLADDVDKVARRLVGELELEVEHATVIVDSYSVEVVPPLDLEQYAASNSAPGALARLLVGLDASEPSDEVRRLIEDAMKDLRRADAHRDFADLQHEQITEQTARDYLREQARALLAELVKDEV